MEPISKHIVQSEKWGEVKTKLGTPAVRVRKIQYTKHKIPFTSYFYGYCPKVNPTDINWGELEKSAREESLVTINFDCPIITKDNPEASEIEEVLKRNCIKSKRNTFAKYNIVLDLSKTEEELLSNMHSKTRYNIKYAQKNGVTIREGNDKDLQIFLELQRETAKRQKFYIHPNRYYETIWEVLNKENMAKLLIAQYNGEPLCSWMLFTYGNTIYYPFGGSSTKHQNLFPNNLICWEAIKLGKKFGCTNFDMWGSAKDPDDTSDPWYGFTKFKLGFGGKHIEHIDSYDLVINPAIYHSFNIVNNVRWAILKLLK